MSPTPGQPASRPGATPSQRRFQLGDVLIGKGLLTQEQLDQALTEQRTGGNNRLLGEVLVEMGFVTEAQVMECLAGSYGVPFARITPRLADPKAIDLLPREFLDAHTVLPMFCVDGTLTVAVAEPANLFLIEEIARISGKKVQIVAATAPEIRATLQAYLPSAHVFVIDDIYADVDVKEFAHVEQQAMEISAIQEMSGQSPVVKLVNYLLYQAIQDRASDIHIEPGDHRARVRYRVDGRLIPKLNPPYQLMPAVASRIKIMAGMDISERRVPQDGDIHVAIDARPIDLRVSTMPGKFGEKVVIRIIDNRNSVVSIEKMGMVPDMLESWRRLINLPNGMVLVTGPTGSGKSTTLYSAINEIASDEINISTVENPVEAQIPGVNQFQVNDKAGFTFPKALRSLLRQDPDVLMVGEIRDLETATIATQAALTGHLVLSTLHTNDAISAVTRLTNMGIEPFLVAAMLRGVLAQRLVRKICPHCKDSAPPDGASAELIETVLGVAPKELFRGQGCSRCRATGFAGRMGIFEMFVPDEVMLEKIAAGVTLQVLRAMAVTAAHRTLREDGLTKAVSGITTVDEVIRASSI
ncbi:MAG: type II/IV secretion system protein [Planctomycetes bacterium]|nr:type II/IV secretion system protein [Planctomycetota bacterium]